MRKSNEKETINVRTSGLFTTLLAIAFIVLKLCHVIEWSWVWILSPIWIPIVIFLSVIIIMAIATGIIER